FKNKSGLSYHETHKYSNYNIPSKSISILSGTYITEAKNVLVYLIKSHLKLNIKHTGLQTVLVPFSEPEFVLIFQNYIKRYSICHQKYICRFSDYDV
ncbi:30749_t:CDS:1, partial [Gigaspora margarita]